MFKFLLKNRLIQLVLTLVLSIFGGINQVSAQITTLYTFSQSVETFTPITDGTILLSGTGSTDSWTSSSITIPTVWINGVYYNNAYITSNGMIRIGGTTAPSTTLYTGISTSPNAGSIHLCPFNADLNSSFNTAASNISWKDVGAEVVFQWKSWRRYGETGENLDFQVRINKNNGVIKFVYNLTGSPGTTTNYQPQVGISSANSAGNYLNRLVNNTAINWNTSIPGTANNSTCRFTNSSTDPRSFVSGQTYTFTPTQCTMPNPGQTIASNTNNLCAGNTINLSLTNTTSGAVVVYQWQGSNDNINFSNIIGATLPTATIAAYYKYYRCKVTCLSTNDIAYSTPVQLNYTNNLTTTDGQRCGAGSVNLSATATSGTNINWFNAQTGGTSIATGNTFTTPFISSTTSYYAEATSVSTGDATLGAGASVGSSYDGIFYHLYGGSNVQFLIKASELTALGISAGNINSLGININSGGAAYAGLAISLGSSTTLNSMSAGAFTGTFTDVYNSSNYTTTTGINTFTFTAPYYWDGVSNIIIKFCWSNNNSGGTNSFAKIDNVGFVACAYYRADNQTPASICGSNSNSGTLSNRPQFIFNAQVGCLSPRMEVNAIINTAPTFTITDNKTICNSAITPLTVTSTQSNYTQVSWSPIANLYTDAAATIPYVANTHAYTVYYKNATAGAESIIATAINTVTQCGGIDTVILNTLPSSATAIATPGSLCVSGTSVIKLSPAITQINELYQWQSSTDNTTFTNIGTSVITDTLSTGNLTATKYYRAIIKNSDDVACFTTVSDTVLVNNPLVVSTTPGSRCGLGTVNLQATTTTGNTLKWYQNATGGSPLGTGNNFTTPVINNSTTFYVAATGAGSSPGSIQIGNGASTTVSGSPDYSGASPYAYHYGNYKHQILILASELTALGATAGSITSLGFDVANAGSPVANFNNFNITLIPTTATALTSTFVTGGTNVFSATSVTPSVGINTYTFTTPFVWDGTSNIIVQSCYNNNNNGNVASSAEVKYDNTSFPSHITYKADGSQNNVCSTTSGTAMDDGPVSTKRPKMILGIASGCESSRVAVLASVNAPPAFDITNNKTACNNGITTLTVTNGTTNYNNVTWSPVTNLYTDAAATVAYTAGTNANTVYFKTNTVGTSGNITALANNATTNCSNLDSVKIQTLPSAITAFATPGEVCQSGTSLLKYTPAITQTGFTQQWGSSSSSTGFTDISGANGLTYTTPAISNTTYYQVAIKNTDGATCITSYDTVKVLHSAITSTTPAERCGPGTLTLGALAIDGITNWYAAATGGTVLATGNTYTTPNLTNTTTYYVSSERKVNDTFTVGTSTTTSSTYPNPFYSLWSNTHNQYLIPAAELTAAGITAGNITSLAIRINSGTMNMQEFSIKMGHTTATNMSAFVSPTFTTVYTAATQTPVIGLNTMNFTTPFNWDGTSNVVVEICHGNSSSTSTMSSVAQVVSTPYVSTIHTHKTSSTAGNLQCTDVTSGLTTYSIRPLFTFRNQYTTCASSPRTAVTATIKTKPVVDISPVGTLNICSGNTDTLSTTAVGTYTWLRNNTPIAGQNGNNLVVSQADPYRVIVTAANGCFDTSSIVNVLINPNPVVNLGNDTSICSNVTYTLDAGNPGATYLWNDNSTNSTLDVTANGNYHVTVTNGFNCKSSDSISINLLPIPVVNLGNDTTICTNVPLILDAQNAGANYVWNTGANTQTISVNQAGNYSVQVTNNYSCVVEDNINIDVVPPIDNLGFDFEPLFNINPGLVRFTPVNINPNYTYTWDFGDGSAPVSQTIVDHQYATTNIYTVTLTIVDACTNSQESLDISVDLTTGITKVNKSRITSKLYPNPSNNKLTFEILSEGVYIKTMTIYNLLGQKVGEIVVNKNNANKETINVNNLVDGAYILKIETNQGLVTRKFDVLK